MSLFQPLAGAVSPLTTKGDIWGFGGGSDARVPVGADGLFLKADSSVTLGISYASPAGAALAVTLITSSVTLGSTIDQAFLSGGTFNITLPNAASFPIKPITLTRIDDAMTLPISIVGLISGTTNWAFYTPNETMRIMPDGSGSWRFLEHYTKTEFTAGVGITVLATTTAPTKATTRQSDLLQWYRDGRYAYYHVAYEQDSGAGGAAGSGMYILSLLPGHAADTTLIPADTSNDVNLPSKAALDSMISTTNNATTEKWHAKLYSSTQVTFYGLATAGSDSRWGSDELAMNGVLYLYGWFKVPISGWKE